VPFYYIAKRSRGQHISTREKGASEFGLISC